MPRDISSIEVTSKVIDLGASVVPLAGVTRAGVVVQHPLQTPGTWLLVIAGILFAFEASPFGSGLRFPPKPSALLWTVFGLGALGVFMLAFARRRLVIATADGQRITLPPTDAQFAAAVTTCIREAIEHGGHGVPHYRIDLRAKNIATLAAAAPGQGSAAHAATAGAPQAAEAAAMPPGFGAGIPQQAGQLPGAGAHAASAQTAHRNPGPGAMIALPAGMPLGGQPAAGGGFTAVREQTGPPTKGSGANGAYRNGAGEVQPGFDRDLVRRLDAVPGQAQAGSAGQLGLGFPAGGAAAMARPAPAPAPDDGGLKDLTALMQLLGRANVQHKEALLDLLRVVEDHKRGGATSREDARAHWQSFAEYVQQYLGNVDGLAEATQRFGRAM